jgi:signal transduction histidine kinase/ligand-binding sensor domain-containing protein/DNA-binding response OmpR family regulator
MRVPVVPLLSVLLLAPGFTTGAQSALPSREYVRENWTVADGLPINTVTSIVQTRDGYLWLGTNDGVVRFDGVRFTVFNSGNTPQLPSNRIISLHEDRSGALWIITEQGHLIRYLNGSFTDIDASRGLHDVVFHLSEAFDGTLVIATTRGAGIVRDGRYTSLTDRFATDSVAMTGGYGGAVKRRDGSYWIASAHNGIWRIANNRLDNVTPPALRGKRFERLTVDPKGRLWISDTTTVWIEDKGFRQVQNADGEMPSVRAFNYDTRHDEMWLYSERGVDVAKDDVARNVTRFAVGPLPLSPSIAFDSLTLAWYANGPELFYNGARIANLGGRPGDNNAPDAVIAIAVDREGSVWIGTRSAGLFRLKSSLFTMVGVPEGILSGNVYPVYEDAWGSVWVGTLGAGVSRIDTKGGVPRVTNFPPSPVPGPAPVDGSPPNPRDFLSDRPDRLWVAALDGIRSCSLPAFRCRLDPSPVLANRLDIHALHLDGQGRLWAGAADGVLRYENGEWVRVPGWPLGAIQVRAFVNAPDGSLWIATGGGGIVRYKDGRFTPVSTADGLPSDVVRAFYVDPDGYLWIGTEGRGLARLDPRAWSDSTRSRRIVHVGTANGLYDEAIHRILADDAGRLWMNTNRGIFWVSRAELVAFAEGRAKVVHSTAYTERDGLRNREGNGGVGSAGTRTRDGRIWFPTQEGVAIVDPKSVTARRVTPPALVERIVAGDSAIIPSGAPINVGVSGRNLSFEYTAMSLLEPKNLRFRYRLDPYDKTWVDAGNRRTAFYTRVPPGSYTFRVQAASPDADFARSATILPLSLAFQPWETSWFRIGVLILLLALTAALILWWSRRVTQRAEELEMVVAERTATLREREHELALQNVRLSELDRAKSRFFANVSHEFRTPLTLTIGPLEGIIGKMNDADVGVSRALDMALRNARRLMRLVNQILDVAKLEAGHMRLQLRPLDVAAFVRGIAEAFAPAASGKGIVLDVEGPASLRGAFDSDALEKIVTNLLSNAVKFTPGGGRVTLSLLENTDSTIMLRVADTGPGIPDSHLPHVFERFYQVDESLTRSETGTGIGLALVQELVTLHGGTITVSSGDLAPGAVFTVTLPLREPDFDTSETRAVVLGGDSGHVASNGSNGAHPDEDDGGDAKVSDVPTLLIVDDSADLRTYVRDHFSSAYHVFEAANGDEGIEVARAKLPDVIVSDVMMPGTDGHALVRALRSSADTDFLPIILLTAHTAMEQRLAGLHGGADDYLTKPFDMRELSARIENLIAQRRRLRERFMAEAERAPVAVPAEPRRVEPGQSQSDRALAARVEAAIAQNLANPDFGVSELAREVAQERSYLFRRTRQLFGESPSDLIRSARLQRGATLLVDTNERVADIAYGVGFNSVSYFSQCFLAAYGMTPSAFRERATKA